MLDPLTLLSTLQYSQAIPDHYLHMQNHCDLLGYRPLFRVHFPELASKIPTDAGLERGSPYQSLRMFDRHGSPECGDGLRHISATTVHCLEPADIKKAQGGFKRGIRRSDLVRRPSHTTCTLSNTLTRVKSVCIVSTVRAYEVPQVKVSDKSCM